MMTRSSCSAAGLGIRFWILSLLALGLFSAPGWAREFLTPKEIVEIREAQEIDRRTELYLKFAALRLSTYKERIKGVESKEGDPLEFFSVADLIYGFGSCLKAVESNLDEAVRYRRVETKRIVKALTLLKNFAGKSLPDLEAASKYAIEKKDETLYNTVQSAGEITQTAVEGSTEGLSMFEKEEKAKKNLKEKKKS